MWSFLCFTSWATRTRRWNCNIKRDDNGQRAHHQTNRGSIIFKEIIQARRNTGKQGEDAVEQHLVNRGFTILERNYTVRGGELDIIATKKDVVVFVEVKTRKHSYFPLSQVITPTKQRVVVRTAKRYLLCQPALLDKIHRFDVALVEGDDARIEYIENAFSE